MPWNDREKTEVGVKVARSEGTMPELLKWASMASIWRALLFWPKATDAKAAERTRGRTNMTEDTAWTMLKGRRSEMMERRGCAGGHGVLYARRQSVWANNALADTQRHPSKGRSSPFRESRASAIRHESENTLLHREDGKAKRRPEINKVCAMRMNK